MPQVIFADEAKEDLVRLRAFLGVRNASAARRAANSITNAINTLKTHPEIGRPVPTMPDGNRELTIEFGDSGYVALYHFGGELVTVLALRHQKECGYLATTQPL
jgi:plasmid stabilization system protein ParE